MWLIAVRGRKDANEVHKRKWLKRSRGGETEEMRCCSCPHTGSLVQWWRCQCDLNQGSVNPPQWKIWILKPSKIHIFLTENIESLWFTVIFLKPAYYNQLQGSEHVTPHSCAKKKQVSRHRCPFKNQNNRKWLKRGEKTKQTSVQSISNKDMKYRTAGPVGPVCEAVCILFVPWPGLAPWHQTVWVLLLWNWSQNITPFHSFFCHFCRTDSSLFPVAWIL